MTLLEALAKAVPLSSSSSQPNLLVRRVAKSESEGPASGGGIGGASGRETSDSEKPKRIVPDFALPPVNFKAWLRGDETASYAVCWLVIFFSTKWSLPSSLQVA